MNEFDLSEFHITEYEDGIDSSQIADNLDSLHFKLVLMMILMNGFHIVVSIYYSR